MEVHRAMPQDVEAQTGQLGNKSEYRLGQPYSEQILTFLEGEELRGFGLCHRFQRLSLVATWALGRGIIEVGLEGILVHQPGFARFHATGSIYPHQRSDKESNCRTGLRLRSAVPQCKTALHSNFNSVSASVPGGALHQERFFFRARMRWAAV